MATLNLRSWSFSNLLRGEPPSCVAASYLGHVRFPRLSSYHSQTRRQRRSLSAHASVGEESPVASPPQEEATAGSPNVAAIKYAGKTASARHGMKLRTALLRNGLSPHNGNSKIINCRGIGSCGTCAVRIDGQVAPAEWTVAEQIRLNVFPHREPNNRQLRLACQVRVMGDLAVTKLGGFWGQGSTEATEEDFATRQVAPFGELEFILDKDSKL